MNKQQLGNSHSQPAPRIGNMYGRRLNAGPASLGSGTSRSGSQPHAPGSSPSTILSRQSSRGNPSPTTIEPTPRVGSLNGRRRNVGPDAVGSGTSNLECSTTSPPAPRERSRAARRRVGTILRHRSQAVHSKDPQSAHGGVRFGRQRMPNTKLTTEDKDRPKL